MSKEQKKIAATRLVSLLLNSSPSPPAFFLPFLSSLELLEGLASGSLLLNWDVGLGTVEDLEEGGHASTHLRVNEGLGALDVIVEIITEGLDQADGPLTVFLGGVAREQHEGDEGNVLAALETLDVLELDGGVAGVEQNLGRVLESGLTPSVNEFLITITTTITIKSCMKKGQGQGQEDDEEEEEEMHTWRKTFPKTSSVSSLKQVEKNTVTLSFWAWT